MRFLKDLTFMPEGQELDSLPEDVMAEIQKNIRAGAKDVEQKWANALELTHKAYEVSGVQRPTPDMKNAWKQYEQNLEIAVQQLSKYRGVRGDWRMSSSMFHEALEKRIQFDVHVYNHGSLSSYRTEARSLTDLLEHIQRQNNQGYDLKIKKKDDGLGAYIQFFRFGVKVKARVDIDQVGIVGGLSV